MGALGADVSAVAVVGGWSSEIVVLAGAGDCWSVVVDVFWPSSFWCSTLTRLWSGSAASFSPLGGEGGGGGVRGGSGHVLLIVCSYSGFRIVPLTLSRDFDVRKSLPPRDKPNNGCQQPTRIHKIL